MPLVLAVNQEAPAARTKASRILMLRWRRRSTSRSQAAKWLCVTLNLNPVMPPPRRGAGQHKAACASAGGCRTYQAIYHAARLRPRRRMPLVLAVNQAAPAARTKASRTLMLRWRRRSTSSSPSCHMWLGVTLNFPCVATAAQRGWAAQGGVRLRRRVSHVPGNIPCSTAATPPADAAGAGGQPSSTSGAHKSQPHPHAEVAEAVFMQLSELPQMVEGAYLYLPIYLPTQIRVATTTTIFDFCAAFF